MKHKQRLFIVCYVILLVGFSAYVMLDTFVIPRSYQVVASTTPATDVSESSANDDNTTDEDMDTDTEGESSTDDQVEVVSTATEYTDDNVSITLTTYREDDTDIYVATVDTTDISYLKTALAENSYGRNLKEKTSTIAEDNDAILAINGDFYGSRSSGYVIRNGVLYRDTSEGDDQEDMVIWDDGTMSIINEGDVSAQTLVDEGAWQVLAFGPGLVEDGEISVTEGEEVGKAMASNPRTAVGITESGQYVFVVADGRTSESDGLSLYELAEFMESLGVVNAYNLDGGGSSTMYFNGEVINNPTTNGRSIQEREVSDIVYIGE